MRTLSMQKYLLERQSLCKQKFIIEKDNLKFIDKNQSALYMQLQVMLVYKCKEFFSK